MLQKSTAVDRATGAGWILGMRRMDQLRGMGKTAVGTRLAAPAWRLLVAFLVFAVVGRAAVARADEGWIIKSFDARIQVQPDGSLLVNETLQVDFLGLQKHGIFRDIPVVYSYDAGHQRIYNLDVREVTDAS